MEVFLLEFGEVIGLLGFFGEFGFGEPLLSFFGGFEHVIDKAIVVAVYFLFEELGDSAVGVLVSPEVAEFLKVSFLHKSFLILIGC